MITRVVDLSLGREDYLTKFPLLLIRGSIEKEYHLVCHIEHHYQQWHGTIEKNVDCQGIRCYY